jgi:3-oxoacyl-[acyl-carrier protein] reductase
MDFDTKISVNSLKHIHLNQNLDVICVFGLGELFKQCYREIVMVCGKIPDVLSDNNPEYWDTNYKNVRCISPELLAKAFPTATVVITVRRYEEVYVQLKRLGFKKIFVLDFERAWFRVSGLRRLESAISEELGDTFDLEEKWALVTGAARGLGAAVARKLSSVGVNLILHGRNESSLTSVVTDCERHGVKVIPAYVDLAEPMLVAEFAASLPSDYPPIDFLINNAAISPPVEVEELLYIPPEYFEKCYRVNAIAPIILSSRLIPQMQKRKFGRIVNVSSSLRAKVPSLHYACSKAALDKYVFDVKDLLSHNNIAISLVDPGWIRTPMTNFKGPNEVHTAVNGLLLPLILNLNGCWISAQDFSNMNLKEAISKARQIY